MLTVVNAMLRALYTLSSLIHTTCLFSGEIKLMGETWRWVTQISSEARTCCPTVESVESKMSTSSFLLGWPQLHRWHWPSPRLWPSKARLPSMTEQYGSTNSFDPIWDTLIDAYLSRAPHLLGQDSARSSSQFGFLVCPLLSLLLLSTSFHRYWSLLS